MHSPSWFYTLLLLLPSLDSPSLLPSTFCNAVDTHDHSKKLDDDEMEEEPREGSVIFPPSARALVKYFPRRLTRFAWLRYYDCRKFRGDRGRKRKRRWKRKRDGPRAKERRSGEERREEKERGERERKRDSREEGWANRANGQVAYLWQPYFRYMNWFPSKVRDATSFQFKMYREVSRRSPSTGKICEGSPFCARYHTSLIPSSYCRAR